MESIYQLYIDFSPIIRYSVAMLAKDRPSFSMSERFGGFMPVVVDVERPGAKGGEERAGYR